MSFDLVQWYISYSMSVRPIYIRVTDVRLMTRRREVLGQPLILHLLCGSSPSTAGPREATDASHEQDQQARWISAPTPHPHKQSRKGALDKSCVVFAAGSISGRLEMRRVPYLTFLGDLPGVGGGKCGVASPLRVSKTTWFYQISYLEGV